MERIRLLDVAEIGGVLPALSSAPRYQGGTADIKRLKHGQHRNLGWLVSPTAVMA